MGWGRTGRVVHTEGVVSGRLEAPIGEPERLLGKGTGGSQLADV